MECLWNFNWYDVYTAPLPKLPQVIYSNCCIPEKIEIQSLTVVNLYLHIIFFTRTLRIKATFRQFKNIGYGDIATAIKKTSCIILKRMAHSTAEENIHSSHSYSISFLCYSRMLSAFIRILCFPVVKKFSMENRKIAVF